MGPLRLLFPSQIDNRYRGQWFGLGFFVAVVALKAAQGVASLIAPAFISQSADAIPLERFGQDGAATVIALFAEWGWETVLMMLVSLFVLGSIGPRFR